MRINNSIDITKLQFGAPLNECFLDVGRYISEADWISILTELQVSLPHTTLIHNSMRDAFEAFLIDTTKLDKVGAKTPDTYTLVKTQICTVLTTLSESNHNIIGEMVTAAGAMSVIFGINDAEISELFSLRDLQLLNMENRRGRQMLNEWCKSVEAIMFVKFLFPDYPAHELITTATWDKIAEFISEIGTYARSRLATMMEVCAALRVIDPEQFWRRQISTSISANPRDFVLNRVMNMQDSLIRIRFLAAARMVFDSEVVINGITLVSPLADFNQAEESMPLDIIYK